MLQVDIAAERHYNGVMKTIRITLRIPEEIHRRVVVLSDRDHRSLNREIVHLVELGMWLEGGSVGSRPVDRHQDSVTRKEAGSE